MKDPRNLLIVALVAAAAFLAGGQARRGEALGQGYPGGTADSNNRMIAVTGTIGSGVSVLWVIDTVDRQLAVYQCRGGKSVELVAARRIEWDLKIDQFHDESLYDPETLRQRYFGKPEGEGTAKPEEGSPPPQDGGGNTEEPDKGE
jgi:hypothetical protein